MLWLCPNEWHICQALGDLFCGIAFAAFGAVCALGPEQAGVACGGRVPCHIHTECCQVYVNSSFPSNHVSIDESHTLVSPWQHRLPLHHYLGTYSHVIDRLLPFQARTGNEQERKRHRAGTSRAGLSWSGAVRGAV